MRTSLQHNTAAHIIEDAWWSVRRNVGHVVKGIGDLLTCLGDRIDESGCYTGVAEQAWGEGYEHAMSQLGVKVERRAA